MRKLLLTSLAIMLVIPAIAATDNIPARERVALEHYSENCIMVYYQDEHYGEWHNSFEYHKSEEHEDRLWSALHETYSKDKHEHLFLYLDEFPVVDQPLPLLDVYSYYIDDMRAKCDFTTEQAMACKNDDECWYEVQVRRDERQDRVDQHTERKLKQMAQ